MKAAGVETTDRQRRYISRLLGRHVRGIEYRHGSPTFRDADEALRYALARAVLASPPDDRREASRLIETLRADPEGGPKAWANRPTPGMRRLRRKVRDVLRRRYGYPEAGWVDRLNDACSRSLEGAASEHLRTLSLYPAFYRGEVVDPLLREDQGGA